MSVPVPVPEPKPFYRRRWFIIVAVIVALTAFGSCLNDGKSSSSAPSPSATEGDVMKALASQSPSTVAAKETQKATTPKGLSDAKVRGWCDGHLLAMPDGANTEVDWSVHWSRTDNADGSVTVKGQSYNRDRVGKRYPSFDVSCTIGADGEVTDFQFVD
ncbi:hypothetical protein [Actinomyces oris]|uniref:hypothetical protein n=1 Tax=Actinomyces oris TaxID=544580 RepID=UPI0028E80464|nr:hypothetical protein [Actinomyces oris]